MLLSMVRPEDYERWIELTSPFARGWLSALVEGEGCFFSAQAGEKRKDGTYRRYPRFSLRMTDEDTVKRAHEVSGLGYLHGPRIHSKSQKQPQWAWDVTGIQNVLWLARMVWPGLGARRRAKVQELYPDEDFGCFDGGEDW